MAIASVIGDRSMAISFVCSCGKRLKATEEAAGRSTRCPGCGALVKVPLQDSSVLPVQSPDLQAPQAINLDIDLSEKPRHPKETNGRSSTSSKRLWVVTALFAVPAIAVVAHLAATHFSAGPGTTGAALRLPEAAAKKRDYPETPEGVIRAYIASDTVEKRLAYVRNPERVASLMRQVYQSTIPILNNVEFDKSAAVNGEWGEPLPYTAVMVNFHDGLPEPAYWVVKTDRGYKIEWEALGYTEISLRKYAIDTPLGAIKKRLVCKIENYYNYNFENSKNTHYSLVLYDLDGYYIHGYVRRDLPGAKELADRLLKETSAPVILMLQQVGPSGEPLTGSNGEYVSISKIVSPSWVDWGE